MISPRYFFTRIMAVVAAAALIAIACIRLAEGQQFTPMAGAYGYGFEAGVLQVEAGGTGTNTGVLPVPSNWGQIPGAVDYWVCDKGLVLGDSGTGVFTWTGQLAGNVLTQATNANQPAVVTNWLQGHCGVTFVNQSSTVILSDATWTSIGYPYTLLAVVEPTTSAPANAAYIINPGSGATGLGMRQVASGLTNYCYDGTLVGSTLSMIVNSPAFVGCMFPGVNDGGQGSAIDNIMLRGPLGEVGASIGSRTTVATGLNVGALGGGGGQGFGGQIGMIGIFNSILNRQYLTQAMAVAQAYYGNAF
jgi:hypothetical protein